MALTNIQLIRRAQAARDRIEMASILVELAERAERDPLLQDTLRKLKLPPPYNVMEYRKPRFRKGYWVKIPYTREHPSVGEVEAKLRFAEINYSLFGTKGTVERPDGTRITQVNQIAGELMRTKEFVSEEDRDEKRRQKIIERIAQATGSRT